jgi:hypothetical protein
MPGSRGRHEAANAVRQPARSCAALGAQHVEDAGLLGEFARYGGPLAADFLVLAFLAPFLALGAFFFRLAALVVAASFGATWAPCSATAAAWVQQRVRGRHALTSRMIVPAKLTRRFEAGRRKWLLS